MVCTPVLGTGRGVRFPHFPLNKLVGDDMLVSEAAKLLDMNPQTLRLALQQEKFSFGVAIKPMKTDLYTTLTKLCYDNI